MITNYIRPQTLEEVIKLLSNPNTRPLGGGTILSHQGDESIAVVDLQGIALNKIHKAGNNLEIGATVTLQALVENPYTINAFKTAINLTAPLNLRNMGTVAGTLVTSNGRSPFATVLLALDGKIEICDALLKKNNISVGDLLPLRGEILPGKLITQIEIPLQTKLAFETVARSPMDKPIVCASLAKWPSGRMRLVIGGWGKSPTLAMDGKEESAAETAARNAAHDANDEWASAEYRSESAGVLTKRCLENINSER